MQLAFGGICSCCKLNILVLVIYTSIFANCHGNSTNSQTKIQLQLLPGSDFLRPENEFTVRFCFVDFNGQKAMELLNDFKEPNETYIEAAAPRLVEGIKRLKAFVSKYQ